MHNIHLPKFCDKIKLNLKTSPIKRPQSTQHHNLILFYYGIWNMKQEQEV